MPGPITYAAITLLARDRIGQIKRALQAKKAAGTAKELELHVLHLATQAEELMNASQPVIEPPVRLYGPSLTEHVSRFTLLGAIGPDLPRYAAFFAPAQRWLFDTLHKGTPDANRERVLVNSTNLVFDFWRRVGPLLDKEFPNPQKAIEAKSNMQAYVLGHLCHIAADVLSHPYFESIEARLSVAPVLGVNPLPGIRYMTRDDFAAALDIRISDQFFSRNTDTRTKKWADWFPATSEVPDAFGQAMSDSITALYGATPAGLPAFDEEFKKVDPAPAGISPHLIREGVDSFRNIMEIERVWTLADWLGTTAAMFLPLSLAYFGALALPQGKNLSKSLTAADGPDAEAIRTYESVVYPVAVTALGPLVTMIIVTASGRGLSAEGVTGWIQAGVSLVAAVGFFATLGGAGEARWSLWFAIPLVLAVAQAIFVIARGARENVRKLLFLGPIVQVVLALLFMLLYHAWLHNGVEELQKDSDERDKLSAFGDFVAWLAIVVALWIGHALLWRYFFSSTVPDDKDVLQRGDSQQFLRLYDDVSLVHDFSSALDSDRLADLAFPPGRRPLYQLWWDKGAGTQAAVQVLIGHDRLVFKWPALGDASNQTVFAPIAPMTVERFGQLLAATVTGDAKKGTLHVALARDDEKGIELAPGAVFGDNGDDKTVLTEYNAAATTFADIGTATTTPFTLFHTVRPRLSQRMGRGGVVDTEPRTLRESEPGSVFNVSVLGTQRLIATTATGGKSPLLGRLFRPGDVLEIDAPAPKEQRIVVQVLNDTTVIVSSPFTFAIPVVGLAGGVSYRRVASDRSARLRGTSPVQNAPVALGVGPNDIQVVVPGTAFGAQFMVGDVVEIATPTPERRTVIAVKDVPAPGRSLLTLDAPAPVLVGGVFLDRVADVESAGFPYIADINDVFGDSGSVMNDAADLAALLCLGGASRLIANTAPPAGAKKPVHRVSQVFRNWNLDRRRVNEWKLIVSGGAESERRGDYRAVEDAAPVEPSDAGEVFSDTLVAERRAADAIVRERGWLPVFRAWVDMASRARNDVTAPEVFAPGQPTNRDLSRAMAYLLDSSEGVV